jgi:hypothetical protein
MPLAQGFYGSKKDGSEEMTYCRFCYQIGEFSEPDMTVDEMIDRSVQFMVSSLRYTKEQAETMSQEVIPTLTRWKK